MKITQKPIQKTHKIGNFYSIQDGQIYILCSPTIGRLSLIGLSTAMRVAPNPIMVADHGNVLDHEWEALTNGHGDKFIPIEIEEIIYT